MSPKRKKDAETRRRELISAAWEVFAEKGVAASTVSDIVKAAGVAQGTFYLYFDSKDEVVNALAEDIADRMVETVERDVADAEAGAVAKLLALRDAILAFAADRAGRELAEIFHRPENRAVHDRIEERITPRFAPLVEKIVRQGIAEGVFTAEDPRVASWFVFGGLHALEVGFTDPNALPAAIKEATVCALRALGHPAPEQACRS